MIEADLPDILIVEDIRKYLRIGRNSAYNLVSQPDFPAIRIGNQIRAKKGDFLQWIGHKGERKVNE